MSQPQSSGIDLQPAPKTYDLELDKSRPPAQTVAWVKKRLELLGGSVLKKTMRIDTGRLNIPVYISLCGDAATRLTGNKKQMGKGASAVQAEASALMELAERFSFFAFLDSAQLPVHTPGELSGPVMNFSHIAHSLYHSTEDLARAQRVFELLPSSWAMARNLVSGTDEQIPLSWFYAINEFNGPAAGNCQEEAVLQAVCEVVERHVSALVSIEKRPTPAIDPDSIHDPVAKDLMNKFVKAGIEVYLKDFSCGLGIPTVAALCIDRTTFPKQSEIVYTAGTATTPAKALIRALTEVAQLAGDFHTSSSYKVSALPKFASLDDARYVTDAAGTVSLDELPDVGAADFKLEVQNCAQSLIKNGFTVYALDVTHPILEVPAVYAIMPGAHFAQRTTGTDVTFHSAKLASQLPDPNEALSVLAAMAQVAGDVYHLPFFQALALLNMGQAADALPLLHTALKRNPPAKDQASIHTQIGVALKDQGRFLEAKKALNQAACFDEPHHEVYNLLGFCHFKLAEYESAIEAFSKAIEIEPGAAINYANIGTNLREMGRVKEARAMYRHALDMDPDLDFARENLEKLSS